MYYTVYVSSATALLSEHELLDLLTTSRRNNRRLGITGMLLYKDGNFMQALEGPREAVERLEETIARDRRHHGMLTLLSGTADRRQFPEWAMGFRHLGGVDAAAVPGFTDFLLQPLTSSTFTEHPTRAHKLLLSFRKAM